MALTSPERWIADVASVVAAVVMEFVAGKVAHFKRLHFVEFVAAIPKTSSGKILRRDLKERERQRIARTTVARL